MKQDEVAYAALMRERLEMYKKFWSENLGDTEVSGGTIVK
jgi:hypothetical protein